MQEWVVCVVAGLLALYVFASTSTPAFRKVDSRAPPFTKDKLPIVGSLAFFTKKWTFFKNAIEESPSGQFSLWLGPHHVIGVSGEPARKMFLDNSSMSFVKGAPLQGVGPEVTPPFPAIMMDPIYKGRTYFVRRLIDSLKTEHLANSFGSCKNDAFKGFDKLGRDSTGLVDPIALCHSIVVAQGCRVIFGNEIPDDAGAFKTYLAIQSKLQPLNSSQAFALPWLPSWSHFMRRYYHFRLRRLVAPYVDRRLGMNAAHEDDTLQRCFIDRGDSREDIIRYQTAMLFIAIANASVLVGSLLNILTYEPHWQQVIYEEIVAMAEKHGKRGQTSLTLAERLSQLPMDAWESSMHTFEMVQAEAIRMHVSFNMIRMNDTQSPIAIPETEHVIPVGSYVAYNSTDVHYDEKLYPDPMKFVPGRFKEQSEEAKIQKYAFIGWGGGQHPCVGMRWAKLQMKVVIAYALAAFKWEGLGLNGQPINTQDDLDHHSNGLPQGASCRYTPRST